MMNITRHFATASHETFTIPPIAELLKRYVINPKGWIDPYAGNNSPAEITNDHNPETKAQFHMEAVDFCKTLGDKYAGVLYDPPYSYRQVSDHYKVLGKKATQLDTSYNFYARVMDVLTPKIVEGGIVISFGWNSNGFGKKRGFEIIEIMLVAHGLHHNDTIVTVEKKLVSQNALLCDIRIWKTKGGSYEKL